MDVGKTVEDVTKKIRTFVAPVIRNPRLLKIMLENHTKLSHFDFFRSIFEHCDETFLSDFETLLQTNMRQFW